MAGSSHGSSSTASPLPNHSAAFRRRRFLNWFPLGLTYAVLYMGRYNLTVAKNALGDLMTKEDFGLIFAAGTVTYAFSFLFNGPLVDRIGGRRGILIGALGSAGANGAMALYLHHIGTADAVNTTTMRNVFCVLYAVNMYFQSYGAVSIVKVNAHWFHVRERGGFSGIFGTMISSGIFLAFTVNGWILDAAEHVFTDSSALSRSWVVFAVPALLLVAAWLVELSLLRDEPGQAGHANFDTGDAGSDDEETPATGALIKRILTNPIIVTVACIEFCTGVLRNGVMHWFPIYAKEVWALPSSHALRRGEWDQPVLIVVCFVVAAVSGLLASRAAGRRRGALVVLGALAFLAPFLQAGWGGLLMVAGILGGNIAGWVSDLFFQSRRGPAAGGLYAILVVLTGAMIFGLAPPSAVVADATEGSGLRAGDRIIRIGDGAGSGLGPDLAGWADVRAAVACWQPTCERSTWDPSRCRCVSRGGIETRESSQVAANPATPGTTIPAVVERDGVTTTLQLVDPLPAQRAGDVRLLGARPVLPLSPFVLGGIVFLMSLCLIGTHGLLSGTATMDFGGRKGAATAVGVIDGFVYLGTAVQSVGLGYLTSEDWRYWPLFLLPFAVLGLLACTRIWNAKPRPDEPAPQD